MAVFGALPPPERLETTQTVGPLEVVAKIGDGRRSTAYIGLDSTGTSRVMRRIRADPTTFRESLVDGHGLSVGGGVPDFYETSDGHFAASVLRIGVNLSTILELHLTDKTPLRLEICLGIASGIGRALSELGVGGVHGDLIPHHIIVGFDGEVSLLDPAGSAALARAKEPTRAAYRSPEHVIGEPLVPGSDIYVLGILLFELSTATRLHPDDSERACSAITEGRAPRPREIVGDSYPIEMQLLLRKFLRPMSAGRFTDARAARDALRLVSTTRKEIGPAEIGGWMRDRFRKHFEVWSDIIGRDATAVERTVEVPLPVRTPSRAKARIRAKHVQGGGAALSIDKPDLDHVRQQIETLDAEARLLSERRRSRNRKDEALMADLARLRMRRRQPEPHETISDENATATRAPPSPDPERETIPDGPPPYEAKANGRTTHDLAELTEPKPKNGASQSPHRAVEIPDQETEPDSASTAPTPVAAPTPRKPIDHSATIEEFAPELKLAQSDWSQSLAPMPALPEPPEHPVVPPPPSDTAPMPISDDLVLTDVSRGSHVSLTNDLVGDDRRATLQDPVQSPLTDDLVSDMKDGLMLPEPPPLDADPSNGANDGKAPFPAQRDVTTQVVRDRIQAEKAQALADTILDPPDPEPDADLLGARPPPGAVPLVALGSDEASSSTALVIPIEDSKSPSRLQRPAIVLIGLAVLVAASGVGWMLFINASGTTNSGGSAANNAPPPALEQPSSAPPAEPAPAESPDKVDPPVEPETALKPPTNPTEPAEVASDKPPETAPQPPPPPPEKRTTRRTPRPPAKTPPARPRPRKRPPPTAAKAASLPPPAAPPKEPPKATGSFVVRVLPDGATISVDGKYEVDSGARISASNTPMKIRISYPGYQTKTIEVPAREKKNRTIMLKRAN